MNGIQRTRKLSLPIPFVEEGYAHHCTLVFSPIPKQVDAEGQPTWNLSPQSPHHHPIPDRPCLFKDVGYGALEVAGRR
jgi:hypothetical protein